MNLAIRSPRRPLASPKERALAEWVSAFTARVRAPELRQLALARGLEPEDPVASARVLVAQGWRVRRERASVQGRAQTLRQGARGLGARPLRALLAAHLRETVPPDRLSADLRALDRDLDLDALLEREAERAEALGGQLEVIAEALGGLLSQNARLGAKLVDDVAVLELLEGLIREEERPATRRAATRALVKIGLAITAYGEDPPGLETLFSLVTDPSAELWCRRAALAIHAALPPMSAEALLIACANATGQDAFIIRARAVELAGQRDEDWAVALLRAASKDPSELVRFTAAEALARRLSSGDTRCFGPLDRLLRRDKVTRVRRYAAHCLRSCGTAGLPMLDRALEDRDPAVVEEALESLGALFDADQPMMLSTEESVELIARTAQPALARAAGELLGRMRARRSPLADAAKILAQLGEGEERRVSLPPGATAKELAEALVPHAQRGFGFVLNPLGDPEARGARVDVWRGDPSALAIWRILHEVRTPNPTKRQGHSHALGRANLGSLRVPPSGLAEENATGVPGQRVRVPQWKSWVPAVPLPEDALHALGHGEVRIVTGLGVTRLRAPRGLRQRLWARLRLTWGFAALDRQRTASLSASTPEGRGAYARALRALGFDLAGPEVGPTIPFLALDPLAYAVSMGANTVPHLILTVVLLAIAVYGRVAQVKAEVTRARRAIPLCVGGWGTRGKSGTERLKAGLFEGLGLPLLSKTTGCEAMVLHAPPGGRAMELFLFRPFDKASIWEQARVVRLGAQLDARVFLWECMGLNPLYIDLLQRGWMNDDLVTLTNAYPDHEDIQGPTGQDVARVIGSFAPRDALTLTAEQSMLPILRAEAERQGSALIALGRAETELVPADLLARMPHAEHPGNVALVARVAAELGLDPTEAIGLMAEHVLPDLGALVVTPSVRYAGRTVTFVNGMSANDEVSFRHNWRYTGFAEAPAEPGLWLMTVVNNRADRVPRSRVFARILVEQAHANRHVIIGTNLEGMRGYIDEALARMLEAADEPRALFDRLRLSDPARLADALYAEVSESERAVWRAACAALPPAPGGLAEARRAAAGLREAAEVFADPERTEALVDAAARWSALQGALTLPAPEMKARYAELFRASIEYIRDPASTGDEIIDHAARLAPPGAQLRLMGVQNIKGTGLDFAYQWVYLRQAHAAGLRLRAGDAPVRAGAVATLEAIPLDSVLVIDELIAALDAEEHPEERSKLLRERALARRTELVANRGVRRARSRIGRALERLLDPFDAILRARRARELMDDLAQRRVSHKRAQQELKRLTLRQKGGWW